MLWDLMSWNIKKTGLHIKMLSIIWCTLKLLVIICINVRYKKGDFGSMFQIFISKLFFFAVYVPSTCRCSSQMQARSITPPPPPTLFLVENIFRKFAYTWLELPNGTSWYCPNPRSYGTAYRVIYPTVIFGHLHLQKVSPRLEFAQMQLCSQR